MRKEEVKILIIDDVTYIRMTLKQFFLNNEFRNNNIEEASNGVEALKKCSEFHPDIIILDLILPKISGLNLIGLLLGINSHVKILICSILDNTQVYMDALQKGAVDWVRKPLNEKIIIQKVEQLLNKSSDLSTDEIKNFTDKTHDFSEKIGIRLDFNHNLQVLNLYGDIGEKEFKDLKETISSISIYKYCNVIINLNGITDLNFPIENIEKLKNKVEKNNGKFRIILLNKIFRKKFFEILSEKYILKTEIQAIKTL